MAHAYAPDPRAGQHAVAREHRVCRPDGFSAHERGDELAEPAARLPRRPEPGRRPDAHRAGDRGADDQRRVLPSIRPGLPGTLTDLTVSPSGVVGTPITPSLAIGGYTFSLTGTRASPGARTFGPIALNAAGTTGATATLDVTGMVSGPGLVGRQAYNGVFTAQFAGLTPTQVFNTINTGGRLSAVSVSAEFNVAPSTTTPEPSSYALLATGIGAIGMAARRRRAQA